MAPRERSPTVTTTVETPVLVHPVLVIKPFLVRRLLMSRLSNYWHIQDQRLHVTALQEALDAANDEIRQLQEGNAKLSSSLAKSNMENRALREERIELLTKVDELKKDLKDERKANEKFRRESLPRTGGTAPAPKERRTMPPRREHADPRHWCTKVKITWRYQYGFGFWVDYSTGTKIPVFQDVTEFY
jgi:septal ring factor EnvC (AmiA/AmiB activator)